MQRFIVVYIVLSALSLTLVGAALALGSAQPMPERLRKFGFTTCAETCWDNIIPNVTTLDEAIHAVNAFTHSTGFPFEVTQNTISIAKFVAWVYRDPRTEIETDIEVETKDGIVSSISIGTTYSDRSLPSLGEVLSYLGPPTCAIARNRIGSFELVYEATRQRSQMAVAIDRLDFNGSILSFEIDGENPENCQYMLAHAWRGVFDPERYVIDPNAIP